MSKNKEVNKAVLNYLNKQNRPYSAVDVFNNMHKEFGKTAVTKALDELAENGAIKKKMYGKQAVYVANQDQFPEVNDEDMKQMELNISALTNELKGLQNTVNQLDKEVRNLNSSLTTEEIQAQIQQLTKENSLLSEKLSKLKVGNVTVISKEEKDKVCEERRKYVKEWRKRKRMTNDILGAILEGYPKTKKQLFEDIGIETDEDYAVWLKSKY
ncbi:PSMC3IP [Acanthosepion pharaonis]|uniref:Homologous-pairing protein 2 homolog n=1 Tax=Acanthosepion pharaonis TaxID=158019 RepID=A0A812DB24_ACAPH|nr:PSMC3IP [Sepia pharaonis]